MLTSETKRRIDACRDILVGKLPLPTDQVELITLALIYKFMDDLDEESVQMGGHRSFFTGALEAYRWRNLLPQTVSAEQRMTLFAEGIEALGHAQKATHLPGLFRDIFRNAFLKFRDGRILTMFLTEVNGFAYSHSEELGNAFEYLLQCMGTQGENGQFRTPRHIIDFVVDCLDPQPGEKILDPACGTGGFLVSAYKHILAGHTSTGSSIPGDTLTHAQRQSVYENLTGYDITDLMVKLSKVNLFLHGFPDPAIHIYDTLSNDSRWHEKADLILANPPFMTPKGGVTPHTKFRIAAKKAEVLFTDYIAEHLSGDGRGGVIVPNGIVATTQNAYVKLRRFLVEDSLVAVVSLPAGVFKPYSGVKTSILLLDKKLARQTKEILFLKITADGFDLGDKRTPIAANDLPEAERVVKLWLAGMFKEGTESAVAWKAAEKKTLLENRSVNLQCEPFLGNGAANMESETVRLGDVAEVAAGNSAPQGEKFFADGQYPFFRTADVGRVKVSTNLNEPGDRINDLCLKEHRLRLFPKDTILFPKSGASTFLNHRAMLGVAGYVSSHLACIVAEETKALPAYLFWLLTTVDARTLSDNEGYPSLRLEQIADVEIPLPPLEEQRRIVAEIEGYQNVLKGARQILAGYRPQLDINPEWEMVKLEDAVDADCSLSYGIVQPGDEFPAGLPVVRPVDLTTNLIRIDGLKRINPKLADGYKRSTLQGGELLLCVRGTTGGVSIAAPELAGANVTRGIVPVRFNSAVMLPRFGFFAICSESVQSQIRAKTYGAALQQINIRDLRELSLPLPPLEEQRRLVAELDAEAAQMDSVRSLLPRFEAKIQRVLARVWGTGED
jgi:type I restriction enzyme M protein